MDRPAKHFQYFDDDGEPCAVEADAVAYVGWSRRRFRKVALPSIEQPGKPDFKYNRLYRRDVLDSWLNEHGTYREFCAARARRDNSKHPRWTDVDGNSQPLSKHPLYRRWASQRSRCNNPNDASFDDYGGRGIRFYWLWDNDPIEYIEYVQSLPQTPGFDSVDRIDNDGNYEPGNLRMADARIQNRNRRSVLTEEPLFEPCACSAECSSAVCRVSQFDWEPGRYGMALWGHTILTRGREGKGRFEGLASTSADNPFVGAGLSESSRGPLYPDSTRVGGKGGDIQSSHSLTGSREDLDSQDWIRELAGEIEF